MCKLVGNHIEKYELILSEMNLIIWWQNMLPKKNFVNLSETLDKNSLYKNKITLKYPIAHHLIPEVSIMTWERTVDSREHQLDSMLAHKWSPHSWALLLWAILTARLGRTPKNQQHTARMSVYNRSSKMATSWILNVSPKARVLQAWSPGWLFVGVVESLRGAPWGVSVLLGGSVLAGDHIVRCPLFVS